MDSKGLDKLMREWGSHSEVFSGHRADGDAGLGRGLCASEEERVTAERARVEGCVFGKGGAGGEEQLDFGGRINKRR